MEPTDTEGSPGDGHTATVLPFPQLPNAYSDRPANGPSSGDAFWLARTLTDRDVDGVFPGLRAKLHEHAPRGRGEDAYRRGVEAALRAVEEQCSRLLAVRAAHPSRGRTPRLPEAEQCLLDGYRRDVE